MVSKEATSLRIFFFFLKAQMLTCSKGERVIASGENRSDVLTAKVLYGLWRGCLLGVPESELAR